MATAFVMAIKGQILAQESLFSGDVSGGLLLVYKIRFIFQTILV